MLEGHHLLEVAGLVLVWMLAVPRSWPRHGRQERPRLELVLDDVGPRLPRQFLRAVRAARIDDHYLLAKPNTL